MFDFPLMPFVVRKILLGILRNKFTEEETRVGWHTPESEAGKVQQLVVQSISQVMKEHWANPNSNLQKMIADPDSTWWKAMQKMIANPDSTWW